MATASNVVDVDKQFDPEGPETLDQYRERVLRDLPQPGFGSKPPAPQPIPEAADAVST
jgi:hypothetical protein